MSKSEPETRPLAFDGWLGQEFADTGGVTALLDWTAVAQLLDGAGTDWDGAAFAARTDPAGGPLPDPVARVETLALGERIRADRMVLNAEHFFDRRGRRLRVDEATVH